jgi:uncharacterized RDD family membrane protein YckC
MSQQYESAPQAPPGSYSTGPSGPRAGFWIRFGALLLDGLILGIPAAILIGIAIAIDSSALILMVYLAFIVVSIWYPIYFEGGPTGATPGKRICGIRVYDLRGGPQIGYGRAFVRWLIKSFISGSIFLLGYLWMLWDKEKQTWHDKIADTVVVPTDAYR